MRRWSWLICSGLMLGAVPVMAADAMAPYPTCDKSPTAADSEAAEGAFKAGFASYSEADYEKAILYWRDAYDRDCTKHLLLKNLASAYERMGEKKATVFALRTYLERDPKAADRAQIEKRIQKLDEQIAKDEQDTGPGPGPVPTASATTTNGPPPPPPDDRTEEEGGKSVVPWIVVGAGGVVTILGGLLWLGGNSKYNDATAGCVETPQGSLTCSPNPTVQAEREQEANDATTQMWVGGAVFGVGLAAVAGGLVWHLLEEPSGETEAKRPPSLQPAVAPNFAGLSLGGTF